MTLSPKKGHSPPVRIYMDHNATTPICPGAFDAMQRWLRPGTPQNASSVHAEGRVARDAVESARDHLASVIGARPKEIVFCAGATEANHLAVRGRTGHVVTTAVEHPSVLAAAAQATDCTMVPVDSRGRVSVDDIASAITDKTSLVSVLWANNETGVLQDLPAIAILCKERDVVLHVDAVQALGRLPIDVTTLGCDLATFSAHKVYGPQGAGALWIRGGVSVEPFITGGHQERGRRAGTENVAAIVGFAAACTQIPEMLADQSRMATLRDQLFHGLSSRSEVQRNGDPEHCLANTLNVSFTGIDGEAMLMGLDLSGVSVSSGSACTAGSLEPSHVLLAMGIGDEVARGAVRFSLGAQTTAAEVEQAICMATEVADRMRRAA